MNGRGYDNRDHDNRDHDNRDHDDEDGDVSGLENGRWVPEPRKRLARQLGLGDAVVLGLGSMLGAGVFAAFGPAAGAAGAGLLLALLLAAVIAYANATASAHLAACYPDSGGTYIYGRRRLGPVWGFIAGWGFLVGKTASCAAVALTFGSYTWPSHPSGPAIAAIVVLSVVNCWGITKTARLTRVLVALTLLTLATVVTAALIGGHPHLANLTGWTEHGLLGILQAAGLLFFAFAGYARIATLGEEVRDPVRTIPRAIPLALGIVIAVYAVVGVSALAVLGPTALASVAAPLAAVTRAGTLSWLTPAVRIGGAVASAGVLLSLMAGVSRTTLAMARNHDLPAALGVIHPRYQVPHRAELLVGVLAAGIVSITDLRAVIGFSSFAILTYYAIANAAAFTLPGPQRRWQRPVTVLGATGCALLALILPTNSALAGAAVLAVGLVGRTLSNHRGRRR
jgi:APA family basic amino acid/polyamine antiporter